MVSVFILFYFFKEITHVGTASRERSLIHKDEKTRLRSARVNCEERERGNYENLGYYQANGWTSKRHAHTKSHTRKQSGKHTMHEGNVKKNWQKE